MFGGEAVVDADYREPGTLADFGADIIMAMQAAKNIAAAMQVNQRGLRAGVDAAGHACNGFIASGDTSGVAAMKAAGHGIIDCPLFGDAAVGGIGWIAGICARYEGPGRGVDKALIICRCHAAYIRKDVPQLCATSSSPATAID